MVFCSNCGTENEDNVVSCVKCGNKLNSKMDWEVKFVALVIIIVVGIFGSVVYVGLGFGIPDPFDSVNQDDYYLPTISGENVSAYKASCIEIDLSTVSIEDDNYLNGKKIKVKGEIYSILQNVDGRVDFLLKVPDLSRYPYIIVSYSTKIPYSIGDELEIYGEYGGFFGYENETAPSIKAAYIEKI